MAGGGERGLVTKLELVRWYSGLTMDMRLPVALLYSSRIKSIVITTVIATIGIYH